MRYLDDETLLAIHVRLMRDVMQETYYGVLNAGLLQSALARPKQAAKYEEAAGLKQGAYLFQGLLMNHGFAQGNKRTAYAALEWFLLINELGRVGGSDDEVVAMCFSAENDKWSVDQIEAWLKANVVVG